MALVPLSPWPALWGFGEPWRVSACQASNDRGPLAHRAGFLEPPGRLGNGAENELAAGSAQGGTRAPSGGSLEDGVGVDGEGHSGSSAAGGRLWAPLLSTRSGQLRNPCSQQASLSPRGAVQRGGGAPRGCELSATGRQAETLD